MNGDRKLKAGGRSHLIGWAVLLTNETGNDFWDSIWTTADEAAVRAESFGDGFKVRVQLLSGYIRAVEPAAAFATDNYQRMNPYYANWRDTLFTDPDGAFG